MSEGQIAGRDGDSPEGPAADPGEEPVSEGSLELVHPDVIAGWAWNSTRPDSPVRVDIFADGELVLEGVLANKYREDLVEAGKGNGRHGFEAVPPESLLDGQVREISARIWGPLVELADSPQPLAAKKPEPDPALAPD